MKESEVKVYVRQLRYYYQELIIFSFIILLVILPIGFSLKQKIALLILGWGSTLLLKGHYFEISTTLYKKIKEISHKWEEKKISNIQEKMSNKKEKNK